MAVVSPGVLTPAKPRLCYGWVALLDGASAAALPTHCLSLHMGPLSAEAAGHRLPAQRQGVGHTPGMTYSYSVFWQGREVIPAPSIKTSSHADDTGGRKAEGRTSSPKALRKRKNFTSVLPAAESYLPKCYPTTELAATQAEKSERPPALAEPESELSSCQRLPAAAQTAGTAGNPRAGAGCSSAAGCPYPAPRGAVCQGFCQLSPPLPVVHAGWTRSNGNIPVKHRCWPEPGED